MYLVGGLLMVCPLLLALMSGGFREEKMERSYYSITVLFCILKYHFNYSDALTQMFHATTKFYFFCSKIGKENQKVKAFHRLFSKELLELTFCYPQPCSLDNS